MSTPVHDTLLARCSKPEGPAVLEVESLTTDQVSRLVAALTAINIQTRVIDGARLTGKADLLRELAAAFVFPSYFGHNWDALINCWSDLSWLPAHGWVCILLNADAFHAVDAKTHDALLQIGKDVADRWHHHDAKAVFKLVRVHHSA